MVCAGIGYNSLKYYHNLDTIENTTRALFPSDDTGRRSRQAFDIIKKIFIFTQELRHLNLKPFKNLNRGRKEPC